MKKAVISNKIFLPYSEELFKDLSDKLTYKFESGKGRYRNIEIIKLCKRIGRRAITIPSGCDALIPKDYEVIDKRIDTSCEYPEFKATLRDEQINVYNDVDSTCLIEANPGWGKTFVGCALAKKFGIKALIIVDKKFLFEQWEDEIRKVFGIQCGVIAGGRVNNSDAPITVATIQTLHKVAENYKNEFGLIIVDEVHKCMAKCFLETMQVFTAKYKIGLSATMGRKDGKHVLFPHIFGRVRHEGVTGNELKPIVRIVDFDVNSPQGKTYADKVSNLCLDRRYMEQLFMTADLFQQKGFKPLIVVPRRSILEEAEKIFPTWGFIHGGVKDKIAVKDGLLDGSLDGIFSETSCFTEGISVNALDCLILAAPINNIYTLIQLIGRITRPHENKRENPVIVDIRVPSLIFQKQFRTRYSVYANKRLEIEELPLFSA